VSDHRQITLTVNGRERTALVEPRLTLADFLREELDLKSVHLGCQYGVCGVCTVLVNGESVRACLMFAVEAEGQQVETVESLSSNPRELHPVQQAFTEQHAVQCGFCTPAMVLRTKELIEQEGPELTRDEIREGISGIVCRCTGYQYIVNAVEDAQGRLRAGANGGLSVIASGPNVAEDEPVAQDKD
jgi:aerobic-type carbon monoxide dehydrogenase small subunit (CoxS/CutS family)